MSEINNLLGDGSEEGEGLSMEEIIEKRKQKKAHQEKLEKKMSQLLELKNVQALVDGHYGNMRKMEHSLKNLAD